MLSFLQFVNEGKDAPIYHGTRLDTAEKIYDQNVLLAQKGGNASTRAVDVMPHLIGGVAKSKKTQPTIGICFSRDKSYSRWFASYYRGSIVSGTVVFGVDTRRLRHNYRVLPLNFRISSAAGDRENFMDPDNTYYRARFIQNSHSGNQQFEEFVKTDKITNFLNYVVSIDVYTTEKTYHAVMKEGHPIMNDPRTQVHFVTLDNY